MNTISIPVLGQAAAGRPVEQLHIISRRRIRPVPGYKPEHIAAVEIVGDSLQRDSIVDGDWAIFRRTFEARPGQLVIALTPDGLTVKYFFPREDGGCLLRAADPQYDQSWDAGEVTVCGVVLRIERDLALRNFFDE